MPPSNTLDIGMDVHQASLAVASGAQAHGAEVTDLGPSGTRPAAIDPRVRNLPSKAHPLCCVYDAGPGGDWLSRDLTTNGYAGWVVAPARMPHKAGNRVNTDRREAVPRARLRRSGDRTPVDVPEMDDDAIRDLSRARAEALGDLKAATLRRKAFWLRHASRDTGWATWGPAHRRGLRDVVCPTPAQPIVFQEDVRTVTEHPERLPRREQALPD